MKRILLTLITLVTLSSSSISQKTLTQWSDSGTKDTTSAINAHQAFLISATFKRMMYLDKKVELLTKVNEANTLQKSQYKGIIEAQDKSISLLNEVIAKEKQSLADENRRKKHWRNATFISAGLLIATWAMIVAL
jgi:PDZ domain-containing secreted protein